MSTNPFPVAPPVPVEAPEPPNIPRARPPNEEIAAWLILGGLLFYVMVWRLVPAVVSGLVLYLVLDRLSRTFSKRLPRTAARPLALILVTLVGGGVIFGIVALLVSSVRHYVYNIPAIMTKMADVLQSTRAWLGDYGEQLIPGVLTDAETIKAALVVWLKGHAETLKLAGGTFSMGLVHMIMGMLLAILVFFRHVTHHPDRPPGKLSEALEQKVSRFTRAFSQIATAQVKISVLNTALTALFLLVGLPLFGQHIPFARTLVFVTFVCGLIPILGNLISNTVIVILSLGISPGTAIAALVFLVIIHKLEYLTNSRIVGGETDSQAWEILMAILIGETAFGISGVVMAPILYAFVKRELRERGLV
ncbi:MAG TPA: AI-2E family transporter [Thermoanaerobaculia bacterium]|jgi:predicted PurR-regulated permease PerM|nr:AI-2E family transporter [Thermoanaerobaculia bacterium]